METHLLRTFVAVARAESFSRAALELGYTQSAVSQHIAALETALATTLLQRRPVVPTEAGARLLEHAAPILLRLDAARADLRRLAVHAREAFTLGMAPMAQPFALAPALAELRRSMPHGNLTLRLLPRDDIVVSVATGELDMGFVDGITAPSDPLRLPDGGLTDIQVISEQPVVVALPERHPLAGQAGVHLEQLSHAHWIDAPDIAAPLQQLRTHTGAAEGFRASLSYRGNDPMTLLDLIAAEHGAALLPAGSVQGHTGVAGVPLTAPLLVHRIETHSPATPTTSARMLLQILTEPGS